MSPVVDITSFSLYNKMYIIMKATVTDEKHLQRLGIHFGSF